MTVFYKVDERQKLLKVDDYYATLQNIVAKDNSDDLVTFDFKFKVSQRDAIKKKATSVIITVFTKNIQQPKILQSSNIAKYDTKAIVDNILRNSTNVVAAAASQKNFVVFTKKFDISSRINNQIIQKVQKNVASSDIQQLYKLGLATKTAAEIKEKNLNLPVLQSYGHSSIVDATAAASASLDLDVQSLAYEMVTRESLDPSSITSMTHRSISSTDAFLGTSRATRSREQDFSAAAKLLNYYLYNDNVSGIPKTTNGVNDAHTQRVIVNQPVDDVEVSATVEFADKTSKENDFIQYFVKFELVNSKNVSFDVVEKQLDIKRHIFVRKIPKKAPIVNFVAVNGRVSLRIKQGDNITTGVRVYERVLRTTNFDAAQYVQRGAYTLKPGISLSLSVEQNTQGIMMYRVVPYSEIGTGLEFTNVVFRPRDYKISTVVSLDPYLVEGGTNITARQIPPNVVSIQFMYKNLSTYDKQFTFLGTPILITKTVRTHDNVSIIHKDPQKYNVYEYAAKLFLSNGTNETCSASPFETLNLSNTTVDTKISRVQITQNPQPNVKFFFSTTTVDSSTSQLEKLLKQQGVYDLFRDTLKNERDLLKSLIAHNIQRIDITTGQREDFGVFTSSSFDDNFEQKNSSVTKLTLGHRYRYEVFALLREAETLFNRSTVTKKDKVTKKDYSYSPAKFLHPYTLRAGTLLSDPDSSARFVKSPYIHGNIGLTQRLGVSFDDDIARILNATATKFDRRTNVITWELSGPHGVIDHFLIYKEVHGIRTFIGKAHSVAAGNITYYHVISNKDEGQLKYGIIPVFDDFKVGKIIETNLVTV